MTTANGATAPTDALEAARRQLTRGKPAGTPFQPWEYTRLFTSYAGGTILDTDWDVRRVEKLIEQDSTSRKNEAVLGQPVRSAPWQILNAPGDAGEGDLCRDVMSRLMAGLIARCTNGFSLRKAFHELVWGLDNGKAVLTDIAWRPTATCQQAWTPDGQFDGFWQQVPTWTTSGRDTWGSGPGEDLKWPGWKRITQPTAFVYIHGRHRQPIRGVSDLDISLSLYEQRRKLTFLLFQFLELQAVPRVAAGANSERKADNRADALLEAKSGGIVPIELDNESLSEVFHVVESSGKGVDQFLATIKWLQQEATNSVLAGFSDLTGNAADGRGSNALSSDQSSFFRQMRQAAADELAEQIADGVLRPLCLLNYGSDAAVPALTIGPISQEAVGRAFDLLKTLVVSPQINAPDGFVDLLIIQTAQFLGLSADEVRAMVDDHRAEREAKQAAARLQSETGPGAGAAANTASHLAENAQRGGGAGVALSSAIALSHELVSRAQAGEDPADAMRAMRERLELARYVRTEAGAKRYGVPIGTPLGAGKAARDAKKTEKAATTAGHAAHGAADVGDTTGKARAAENTAGRAKTTRPAASDRLRGGELTGPDGLGKRQTSAAKFAVTHGRSTYVDADGTPGFDPPAGKTYTRFDPNGTAWKSVDGDEPRKVPAAQLKKLYATYLTDRQHPATTPAAPSKPGTAAGNKTTAKLKAEHDTRVRSATKQKVAADKTDTAHQKTEWDKKRSAARTDEAPTQRQAKGPSPHRAADGLTVEHQMINQAAGNVTPEDRQLVNGYAGATYEYVNNALRGKYSDKNLNRDRPFLSRDELDQVRDRQAALDTARKLTAVIDAHRVPQDVTVTRVVAGGRWLPNDIVGKQIVNKGFVSTSLVPNDYEGSTVFEINVPAGFHAASLEAIMTEPGKKRSATESEQHELILPHGTIFHVRSEESRTVGGRKVRVLKVDAAPPTVETGRIPAGRR